MSKPKLELLIDAAKAHGEQSEPDHEAGDLADILRDCWATMTPKAREAVYKLHEDKVTDWGMSSAVEPDLEVRP